MTYAFDSCTIFHHVEFGEDYFVISVFLKKKESKKTMIKKRKQADL
jgi:hypothetical protein